MHEGLLFVLSSPSGTGKTTVARKLAEADKNCVLSVSHTTRSARKNEVHGKDYFFVHRDEFEKMTREGRFLEWAEFQEEFYGTTHDFVKKTLEAGKDVILIIDVKGAKQVKEKYPGSISIFLLPPSVEELKKRLRNRETEGEEETERRLGIASWEQEQAKNYDYRVVNDKIETTVEEVLSIIRAEREKRK